MDKLRVAVIGCGRISVMHFDGILSNLDKVNLVACCDNKIDRANKCAEKYHAKAYYDYKDLLDNEKLDAIHICLPHYLHTEVAEYAFKKHVHVLSEKPMDINYSRAVHAVEMAKKYNVLYGIIFQCRYNESFTLVQNALKEGKLGKIIKAISILTWNRSDEYYLESDWKGTWDKEGGGVIIDQAIHSIDMVNKLIDSTTIKVDCHMSNRGHKYIKVEDTAEGLITYANGVQYAFYAMNNYGDDEPIQIKLYCEKGKVEFSYLDALICYNNGEKEEVHQTNNKQVEGGKSYWGFKHYQQITNFYNAILGLEKLEISGEECLKTHRLICDLYEIGKRGL